MKEDVGQRPETLLPTKFGTFRVRVYEVNGVDYATAIIAGETQGKEDLPLRVHSSCLTGESFESLKCDCKPQLDIALQYINANGGVVLYLQQEGRGIGLGNKIRAYALQEQGHDTVDANLMLGFAADLRTYDEAAMVVNDLGIKSVRLMTNNPEKVSALKELGINITGRIPVLADVNRYSAGYLEAKRVHMGHMLELNGRNGGPTRPFVHVNFAVNSFSQSCDKNGDQINLSCSTDWQRVHTLRETYTAVAVGANTWFNDNPQLTAREAKLGRKPSRQPDRIIFAGKRHCSFTPDDRRTFVVGNNHPKSNDGRIALNVDDHNLEGVLYDLRKHEVTSILVEGGATLIQSFMRQGFIDLLTVYVATKDETTAIKAAQKALPFAPGDYKIEQMGDGTLISINAPQFQGVGQIVKPEKMAV